MTRLWLGGMASPYGCRVHGWARPKHYDELRDRECPGWTEYHPGDLDAPCDTCGGRTGWAVADIKPTKEAS